MNMKDSFYLVITKGRYYGSMRVSRLARKVPKLKQGEVTLKVELEADRTIFEPKTTALVICPENIIRNPANLTPL